MPNLPSTSANRHTWPRWVPIASWSLLGLLGATFVAYMLTVTFGAVHGVEFCPQTFERRSYSFYELPLVGIQLTGIRHEDLSSAAETALTSQKLVTPPASGQQDWHIVVGSRGPRLLRKGDASILMQYLDAMDADNNHRWIEWSNHHTELAKLFWPAIQKLAAHDLYVFVPDLFDLTKSIDDPMKLQQSLDHTVAAKLIFLAERLASRSDQSAAAKVLEEASALDADNPDIQRLKGQVPAAKASASK